MSRLRDDEDSSLPLLQLEDSELGEEPETFSSSRQSLWRTVKARPRISGTILAMLIIIVVLLSRKQPLERDDRAFQPIAHDSRLDVRSRTLVVVQ